ncbi:DUF3500 domain-containing protein [Mycobacterium sp. 1465703.0]|uniref:DUF3500 domain-containing protein n=1 Tax=Mycobacterium sp. 1465703.0 TaxID=1834078 RepID=UPI0009F53AC0
MTRGSAGSAVPATTRFFYYRIQSPVIIVEFDHNSGLALSNPECERFHIHTLVRTPNGNDYGVQLVRAATSTPPRLV